MERAVLLTGIGGQGIQLAAQVLARAAIADGRHVQVFGSYGGMMRGGNTDATVVVADAPVASPPTVSTAWGALVMHHEYAAGVLARLEPGGLAAVNTSVVEHLPDTAAEVLAVRASDAATELGAPMAASMVLLGVFASRSGLATLASLSDAVTASLPPYRTEHIATNVAALETGYAWS